ncbi:hypothetical protein KR038_008368 [Drosophila bunnanda]|nr:hypothetical protein KR038_008368 [Drosophila bunnanda]
MRIACTLGEKIFLICVFLGICVGFGVEGHLLFSLTGTGEFGNWKMYTNIVCEIVGLSCVTGSKKCHDVCPMGYRVVCALDVLDGCLRTFASTCIMRMYNCKYQKDYRIIAERACEFITNDDLDRLTI